MWDAVWPNAAALLVALLAAWIVYRVQRREEREGLLAALVAELQLHEGWVGGQGYTAKTWQPDEWFQDAQTGKADWHKIVYKVSTVAVDDAIQSGPSLFINQGLVFALTQYRQRAQQLNQLIDDMAAFRASAEVWLPPDKPAARAQLKALADMIHLGGIGDQTEYPYGANFAYTVVRQQLRKERTASRGRRWAWFWVGRTQRAGDQPELTW